MRIDRETKRGKIYQSFLYLGLCLTILLSGGIWMWDIWNKVPSNIHVRAGVEQGLEFCVPATATIYKDVSQGQVNVDLNREIMFYGKAEDTYTMKTF